MRCLTCPVAVNLVCRSDMGPSLNPAMCERGKPGGSHRKWLIDESLDPDGLRQADTLAKILACPHRGPILPHTQQPEGCGRGCGDLYWCGANQKGVSRQFCTECVETGRVDSQGND